MTVAKRLAQKYTARATEWQAGQVTLATIQAWVGESDQLAKEIAYGKLPGFACGVDMEQTRIALSKDDRGHRVGLAGGVDMEQTRIALSKDYVHQAEAAVEEQLAKAGYRLAAILNRALGD